MNRIHRWIHSGIPAGRIQGIPVYLHLSLLLLVLFWVALGLGAPNPAEALLRSGLMLVVMFCSVLLHELGHCYGARLVGGQSEGIVLWPLGGMAYTTGSMRSPYDEFVVTVCGPAVNLILAAAASAFLWVMPDAVASTRAGAAVWMLVEYVQIVNVLLFVFNVAVPLFPMDCARILRSLFSMKYDPQRVTYNICLAGFFVAGVMATLYFVGQFHPLPFFGITFNLLFLLVAAFGLQSSLLEMRALEYHYVYAEPWRTNAPLRALLRRMRFLMNTWREPAPRRPKPQPMKPAPDPEPEPVLDPPSERDQLEKELREAVEKEDFVRAAEIRDRLRGLPAESNH